MRLYIKGCLVIQNASSQPEEKNILIENGKIKAFLSGSETVRDAEVRVMKGKIAIPGFVQPHIHFCQTLFRGLVDDAPLLGWLKKIWPLEASHDDESTYYSSMLSCLELISGGTTQALDMESVRYADASAKAIEEIGFRATVGKCLMDYTDTPNELGGMPAEFIETTKEAISGALAFYHSWHGKAEGRITTAFMPRGILTTSEELLYSLKALSEEYGILIHTHACETASESELVAQRRGETEIKYLDRLGITSEKLLLAHCVCVDEEDIRVLGKKRVKVVSCPLTNLKLASGVAPIDLLMKRGIPVSLASDGAPANNNLDIFGAMKTAALLQKGVFHDATMAKADEIFYAATMGGAKALRTEQITGSLEVGKKADITFMDFDDPSVYPTDGNVSSIVYAGGRGLVSDTLIDGRWVYKNRTFPQVDTEKIVYEAKRALKSVLDRFERR